VTKKTKSKRCKAIARRSGKRCKNVAEYGHDLCYRHIKTDSEYNGMAKESEYQTFLLWYSIPAVVRKLWDNVDKTGKTGKTSLKEIGYDVDDPVFELLVTLKTQKEFAKAFNVSEDTLTDWKKRKDFNIRMREQVITNHVLKFEKEIDFMFTHSVMKKPSGNDVKIWKQVYAGYTERLEHSGLPLPVASETTINIIHVLNEKDPKSGRKLGEILRDIEGLKKEKDK